MKNMISSNHPFKHLLCVKCGARLVEGRCKNPFCVTQYAAPGVPTVENRFTWKKTLPDTPAYLESLSFREKHGIPKSSTVAVYDHNDQLYYEWTDNSKWRGTFGGMQHEFMGGAGKADVMHLCAYPAETGFVFFYISNEKAFETLRFPVVNPLPPVAEDITVSAEDYEPLLPGDPGVFLPKLLHKWDDYHADDTWRSVKQKKSRLIKDILKHTGSVDDYLIFKETTGSYPQESTVMSGREFAAHTHNLYNLDNRDHHPAAYKLAFKLGITLVGSTFCPLMPPRAGKGDPLNLWDYLVDCQPIVGMVVDVNKHTAYFFPDDGRSHHHGSGAVGFILGEDETIYNGRNICILFNPKRRSHTTVGFYIDDLPVKHQKEAITVVAELLRRMGAPDDFMLHCSSFDVSSQCLEDLLGKSQKSEITDLGQHFLDDIVAPYMQYAGNVRTALPVSEERKAINSLRKAVKSMKKLCSLVRISEAVTVSVDNLAESFDSGLVSVGELIAGFSLVKQRLHQEIRLSGKEAASLLGDGFCDCFGR